jgi:transcriptional regulator with XRE-family HTH domain
MSNEYDAAVKSQVDKMIDELKGDPDAWSFMQLREKLSRQVNYKPFPTELAPFAAFLDYADGTGAFETGTALRPVCPPDRKHEGAELKAARRAAGLNLIEAAARLGVSVANLTAAEISYGAIDPHVRALELLRRTNTVTAPRRWSMGLYTTARDGKSSYQFKHGNDRCAYVSVGERIPEAEADEYEGLYPAHDEGEPGGPCCVVVVKASVLVAVEVAPESITVEGGWHGRLLVSHEAVDKWIAELEAKYGVVLQEPWPYFVGTDA